MWLEHRACTRSSADGHVSRPPFPLPSTAEQCSTLWKNHSEDVWQFAALRCHRESCCTPVCTSFHVEMSWFLSGQCPEVQVLGSPLSVLKAAVPLLPGAAGPCHVATSNVPATQLLRSSPACRVSGVSCEKHSLSPVLQSAPPDAS